VGRLNRQASQGPADQQAAQQATPEAALADLQRRSQLALGAAFVMLIGAVIAFALHTRPVGIVLLVLMLLGGMASFWFSVKFRNRAVAEARAARQAQAVRAAASRKKKPTRPGS
jgi:fatty acid desaturase